MMRERLSVARCCCGDCPHCLLGDYPSQFQVVIAGVVGIGVCSDCDDYNGTFICDFTEVVVGTCNWIYAGSGNNCSANNSLTMTLYKSGANYMLEVAWTDIGLRWQKSQLTKFDCENLTNLDVPFYDAFPICGGDASTCTVTSL